MSMARQILLVDDDQPLRESLAQQLMEGEEFVAAQVGDAASALAAVKGEHYDIVLLDIGLPDMDGREVCKLMRRNGFRSPIIILTGADTDADAILGLESGANDYIVKPFRLKVLLARIRAQLRQHDHSEDAVFTIGHYKFRPAAKLMVDGANGRNVRLTTMEASILKYLYRAGDKAVSRNVLLQELWGYNADMITHTLDTHIYRLRQKIEVDPSNSKLLVTEVGGYRLIP